MTALRQPGDEPEGTTWFQTATGGVLYVDRPDPAAVRIQDLAHALARICRFGGHVNVAHYCVTPETRVLTDDLRWVQAGDLHVGDGLLAFDEHYIGMCRGATASGQRANRRKIRHAVVEVAQPIRREIYRLTLSDGTVLRCSAEHPWLTSQRVSMNTRWETAADLAGALRAGRRRFMRRYLQPWKEQLSYDAGYVAGIFDGEGHISFNQGAVACGFAQKAGGVLDRTVAVLRRHGVGVRIEPERASGVCVGMLDGRWSEKLSALGRFRPERLIEKFVARIRDAAYRFEFRPLDIIEVTSAVSEGWGEVTGLQTSSRTFFAEGFCAHNSVAQHSVIVSLGCPPEMAMLGLLHDAAEAYLGDIIRPLKLLMPGYKELERRWELAIGERFGLSDALANLPPEVKLADERALATERRDLLADGPGHRRWQLKAEPFPDRIHPLGSIQAMYYFLARYDILGGRP